MEVPWHLDISKLQAAVNERIKVQGRTVRTFAQIVNTALFSVALKAQKYTPATTTAKIDAALHVEVNYETVGSTEPLVSMAKTKRKGYTYSESNSANRLGEHAEYELAFAIVLARANISKQGRATGMSLYNRTTAGRWELTKDDLRGGRSYIEHLAEKMINARHSSTSMLRAGWKPAMDILRPYIAANAVSGVGGERFPYDRNLDRLGTATPARPGWKCEGFIENHIGEVGALGERQRAALLEFGTEPFQAALQEEALGITAKVEEYLAKDAAAFRREMR